MSTSPKEEKQVQLEEHPQNKKDGQNEGEDRVQDEEQPWNKQDGGNEEEDQAQDEEQARNKKDGGHEEVQEHAQKEQDVDKKRKRPLEASSEDEQINRQKKGKDKIELGGYSIKKYGNLRRHEYLDKLVHDTDTQEAFLEAILVYYNRHHRHPLHEDMEIGIFMWRTLQLRNIDIDDLKRAIDMVWKDKKELEIRAIEETLEDKKRLKRKP